MTPPVSAAAARHPRRCEVDADFHLDQLLALPAGSPPDMSVSAAVRLLLPDRPARGSDAEPLHALETSTWTRPPADRRTRAMSRAQAAAAVAAATEWVDPETVRTDPRYVNLACKLAGLAALYHRDHPGDDLLTGQLGTLGRALTATTTALNHRLRHRLQVPAEAAPPIARAPKPFTGRPRARVAVLTRPTSRMGRHLVTGLAEQGITPAGVCWYDPPAAGEPVGPSNYARAWYPDNPDQARSAETLPGLDGFAVGRARSWQQVADMLAMMDTDLVLLAGMPIVPPMVLAAARLGVVNAHNGALPALRGMDAVGWALLTNQPIVCTAHMARARVDAGEILATTAMDPAPAPTLAARVACAQRHLLVAVARYTTVTGRLPDLMPQQGPGRQYYRLHPHLKRILDDSPYNHATLGAGQELV